MRAQQRSLSTDTETASRNLDPTNLATNEKQVETDLQAAEDALSEAENWITSAEAIAAEATAAQSRILAHTSAIPADRAAAEDAMNNANEAEASAQTVKKTAEKYLEAVTSGKSQTDVDTAASTWETAKTDKDPQSKIDTARTAFTKLPSDEKIADAVTERTELLNKFIAFENKALSLQALTPSGAQKISALENAQKKADSGKTALELIAAQLSNPTLSKIQVDIEGTTYTTVDTAMQKLRNLLTEAETAYERGKNELSTAHGIPAGQIAAAENAAGNLASIYSIASTARTAALESNRRTETTLNDANNLVQYAAAIYYATEQAQTNLKTEIDSLKTAIETEKDKATTAATDAENAWRATTSSTSDLTTATTKSGETQTYATTADTAANDAATKLHELKRKVDALEGLVISKTEDPANTALDQTTLLAWLAEDARDLADPSKLTQQISTRAISDFAKSSLRSIITSDPAELSSIDTAVTATAQAKTNASSWKQAADALVTLLQENDRRASGRIRGVISEVTTKKGTITTMQDIFNNPATGSWESAKTQTKPVLERVFTITIADITTILTQAEQNQIHRSEARTAFARAIESAKSAQDETITRAAAADAATALSAAQNAYVASRQVLIASTAQEAEAEKIDAETEQNNAGAAAANAATQRKRLTLDESKEKARQAHQEALASLGRAEAALRQAESLIVYVATIQISTEQAQTDLRTEIDALKLRIETEKNKAVTESNAANTILTVIRGSSDQQTADTQAEQAVRHATNADTAAGNSESLLTTLEEKVTAIEDLLRQIAESRLASVRTHKSKVEVLRRFIYDIKYLFSNGPTLLMITSFASDPLHEIDPIVTDLQTAEEQTLELLNQLDNLISMLARENLEKIKKGEPSLVVTVTGGTTIDHPQTLRTYTDRLHTRNTSHWDNTILMKTKNMITSLAGSEIRNTILRNMFRPPATINDLDNVINAMLSRKSTRDMLTDEQLTKHQETAEFLMSAGTSMQNIIHRIESIVIKKIESAKQLLNDAKEEKEKWINIAGYDGFVLIKREMHQAANELVWILYPRNRISAHNALSGFEEDARKLLGLKGQAERIIAELNRLATEANSQPDIPPPPQITIATVEDLAKIGIDTSFPLDGDYTLTADLSLRNNLDWAPIGLTAPFSGTFDGNNHTISDFKHTNSSGRDIVGLFGKLAGSAEVKNLTIVTREKIGDASASFVGVLAGRTQDAAGLLPAVKIENVQIQGEAVLDGFVVGGLIGEVDGKIIIRKVHVHGLILDITRSGIWIGPKAGGLIGRSILSAGADDQSFISSSSFKGSVQFNQRRHRVTGGGFIGEHAGEGTIEIQNSYVSTYRSTDSIYNAYSQPRVGGFLHSGVARVTITNSYLDINVHYSSNQPFWAPLFSDTTASSYYDVSKFRDHRSYKPTEPNGITGRILQRGDKYFDSKDTLTWSDDVEIFIGWDFTDVWQWRGAGLWPELR